jgi:4-aminobutyrate aminotransferase/(S)-3-amino-2-methylpropionate transaminase
MEESRCLEEMEKTMRTWQEKQKPVAAVIVEPILSEGGDKHASPLFFRTVRKIAADFNAAFIVDEVQTGGGPTGEMWAHQSWQMEDTPDFVTFGKKMLQGGFFYKNEYKVDEPYRIMNTWHGDPSKLILLRAVIEQIKTRNLLDNARSTGQYLLDSLASLAASHPTLILNPRGQGTFCAVDCPTTEMRNRVVNDLKRAGILIGGCGEVGIRFRPSLTLEPHHVDIFHTIAQQTLAKIPC